MVIRDLQKENKMPNKKLSEQEKEVSRLRKKEKIKEYQKRKREDENYIIYINCRRCETPTAIKKYYEYSYLRKGGATCKKCRSKISSDWLKNRYANMSIEELSLQGKNMRSKVKSENLSAGITKQWADFRADPKKYKQICEAKSDRMVTVWENYPEETRNKICKALAGGNKCGRSKVSNRLKEEMERNGIDGFESEQMFHGFQPDEINNELKIIVEMYGDLYHCNPRKYKNPDLYIKAINRTVQEQWTRDRRRLGCFYKHGYTVVIVWEKDFYTNPDKQIKRIKDEIKRKETTKPDLS